MIRVVYCFDGNLARHVCVVISSLLMSKKGKDIHYEVICICTNEAAWVKELLHEIIKGIDAESKLTFISVNNTYDNAYEIRGITSATYMRFMLPSLLPNIDKVIYMDVDFIVDGNLKELWDMDMNGAYFAGSKADVNINSEWEYVRQRNKYWTLLENWKGKYINAGILVMNLDKIRKDNITELWDKLSKENFYYQDQDIINITCQGYKMVYNEEKGEWEVRTAIRWIPLKYNMMAFMNADKLAHFVSERIYTDEEVNTAIEEPIGIHYAGKKPWNDATVLHADMWWRYVLENNKLRELFRDEIRKCIYAVALKNIENGQLAQNKTDTVIALETRAKRNNANFLLLNDWIKLIEKDKSIGKYIVKMGYSNIAIYGMHYIGERLYKELTSNGVQVQYGIDKNIVQPEVDIKVLKPDDALPEVDAIVVTPIYFYDSIKKELRVKVKCPILSLKDIIEEILERF